METYRVIGCIIGALLAVIFATGIYRIGHRRGAAEVIDSIERDNGDCFNCKHESGMCDQPPCVSCNRLGLGTSNNWEKA